MVQESMDENFKFNCKCKILQFQWAVEKEKDKNIIFVGWKIIGSRWWVYTQWEKGTRIGFWLDPFKIYHVNRNCSNLKLGLTHTNALYDTSISSHWLWLASVSSMRINISNQLKLSTTSSQNKTIIQSVTFLLRIF